MFHVFVWEVSGSTYASRELFTKLLWYMRFDQQFSMYIPYCVLDVMLLSNMLLLDMSRSLMPLKLLTSLFLATLLFWEESSQIPAKEIMVRLFSVILLELE